jgi:hypothetical protein
MKYGYHCECGWTLRRGKLTRKKYAEAKRNHAEGCDPDADFAHQPKPCDLLGRKLARTAR